MISLDNKYFTQIIDKKIYEKNYKKYIVDSYKGNGYIKAFKVMDGLEVAYLDMDVKVPMKNMLNIDKKCIEITCCLNGQAEIMLDNGKYIFMSDGDISLFGYQTKAAYCDVTGKHFKGIRIMIYIDKFILGLNKMFDTDNFEADKFFGKIFNSDRVIISHGNVSLNHILKELYVLPDEYNEYLMRIKVVELIFYLVSGIDYKKNDTIYFSKESIEKIKEARKILLDNLDKFITIKELSKQVNMNTTDLEKGFKSIYGTTIFTYGKMEKMKKAKELLEDEALSILEVSLAVGYSNGGKFAKAFKEAFGMLPTQYRKEKGMSK